MISPGFPDFVSRQTCAKQGTFLAEATGDICTLDLKQSWLGIFRLQQQLTEEAPLQQSQDTDVVPSAPTLSLLFETSAQLVEALRQPPLG